MQSELGQFNVLMVLGILAAAANVLGGLLIFSSSSIRNNKKLSQLLIAFSAGFVLAVIFIEILPRTLGLWFSADNANLAERADEIAVFPMLLLLGGYLLIHFVEQTFVPHVHLEDIKTDSIIAPSAAYSAIGGLFFHAFFDGVAIAAAAFVNFGAGVLIFLAVFLHKVPEGLTVASLMLSAGQSAKRAVFASGILGIITLFGVAFFAVLRTQMNSAVAYLLPIAAGVTLYVAASELIPELHHHNGRSWRLSFCVIGGVAVFFLLHYFFHGLLEA
ncbi:MAG: ZIP family metal transporter [Pyrinomonadaceae bacterium]|nr:ZIP family metal transporter [Pyrinomonadaceae bacterium]